MSSPSVDDLRHALTLARANGWRQVEVGVGENVFSATLGPRPKKSSAKVAEVRSSSLEPMAAHETAPMVGYFRASVSVGEAVAAGAKIGAIMALGIANDVIAEHGGAVAEVLVGEDGAVEYGQPLIRYETGS